MELFQELGNLLMPFVEYTVEPGEFVVEATARQSQVPARITKQSTQSFGNKYRLLLEKCYRPIVLLLGGLISE
jgi:hypothetical protein